MPERTSLDDSRNYFLQFFTVVRRSAGQLVSAPSHSLRAQAARRLARNGLVLTALTGAAILALVYALDAREIAMMPPRGTASLWPVRILTDFGKDAYVLWSLAAALLAVAIVSPLLRGNSRVLLLGFGTRLQYLFFAVLVPVLAGQLIKWIVGRGRPFAGGKADALNFHPFTGTEAYASFPSGHATTSFALAFAVSAIWPQARIPMIVYAVLIAMSRLVLLAHHPSDVVAGGLIGVLGAMVVRYWFAERRLGFAIRGNGEIVSLALPGPGHLKRVARSASAP